MSCGQQAHLSKLLYALLVAQEVLPPPRPCPTIPYQPTHPHTKKQQQHSRWSWRRAASAHEAGSPPITTLTTQPSLCCSTIPSSTTVVPWPVGCRLAAWAQQGLEVCEAATRRLQVGGTGTATSNCRRQGGAAGAAAGLMLPTPAASAVARGVPPTSEGPQAPAAAAARRLLKGVCVYMWCGVGGMFQQAGRQALAQCVSVSGSSCTQEKKTGDMARVTAGCVCVCTCPSFLSPSWLCAWGGPQPPLWGKCLWGRGPAGYPTCHQTQACPQPWEQPPAQQAAKHGVCGTQKPQHEYWEAACLCHQLLLAKTPCSLCNCELGRRLQTCTQHKQQHQTHHTTHLLP